MIVRVVLSIEIDPDAWILNYGTTRGELREDVKQYVDSLVHEHLAEMGVLDVKAIFGEEGS